MRNGVKTGERAANPPPVGLGQRRQDVFTSNRLRPGYNMRAISAPGPKVRSRTIADDIWVLGAGFGNKEHEAPMQDEDHSLVHNGLEWTLVPTPKGVVLKDVWGAARDQVWGAGPCHGDDLRGLCAALPESHNAVVVQWDGATWSLEHSYTGEPSAMSGISARDIWLGDSSGAMLRFDGESWAETDSPGMEPGEEAPPLKHLLVTAADEVFAVFAGEHAPKLGSSPVWRFDGSDWALTAGCGNLVELSGAKVKAHKLPFDRGVFWGSAADDAWLVSGSGAVLRRQPAD